MMNTHSYADLASGPEPTQFRLWMRRMGYRKPEDAGAALGLGERQIQNFMSGAQRPRKPVLRLMGLIAAGHDPIRHEWPAE